MRRPGPVLRPAPPVQCSRKVGEVEDSMLGRNQLFRTRALLQARFDRRQGAAPGERGLPRTGREGARGFLAFLEGPQ